MADNMFGDVPLELQPQMQNISQQQKLSQMLLQQGMQQPQGQMVSGHYVGPALTQYLQPLFGAYAGNKGMENAEQKQLDLAKAVRQIGSEETQKILELAKTDPNAAMTVAANAQTPQGKAFAPALMQNVLPKKTDKLIEYDTYKAETPEGKRLSFTDWADRNEKAKLALDEKRYGLDAARFNLEKSKAEVNPAEAGLRTSFLGQIQPHVQISQAYRKIEAAPETAAGDMSRIFGYMKILDPGSTVREGEYASAENARGVPDSVRAQYNKVMSGQRLTPQQRQEFTQSAGDLVNSQKTQFETQKKYYTDISNQYRINPSNIIYDPYADLTIKTTPPKAPKTVVNAGQQLNIPQAGGGNGWNIVNVTPSK